MSNIYWDAPYNPVVGCNKVSPGCANCYAKALHTQRHKALLAGKKMPECYRKPFNVIQLLEDRLDMPLHWKQPKVIFCCNMGDLFHPDVPFSFARDIFWAMFRCKQHTFLILTKRPQRMETFVSGWTVFEPLENVWLGVTICNQKELWKLDILRNIPAARRWVSAEPLLEDLDELNLEGIDQIILGGETGPKARPMHPDWARSVRDQCKEAGIPFYLKSLGQGKGRELDGREHNDLTWRL